MNLIRPKGEKTDLDTLGDSIMGKLKVKIATWLLDNCDYLLVARTNNEGIVAMKADEDAIKHLRAILHASFLDGQEQIKEVIIGATEDWLKEREVETKNFIERIK